MPIPIPWIDPNGYALFLDVDGTLLDFQSRPETTVSDSMLNGLLLQLDSRLKGALALVSGRYLNDIDRIFSPHRFAAAGSHGLELRTCGEAGTEPSHTSRPPALIQRAHDLAARWPGAFVEIKPYGVAVHYRNAPAAEGAVRSWAKKEHALSSQMLVLNGKMVCELTSSKAGKGTAIRQLLSKPAFHGRRPIFIGDDITDEPGFESVNALQGLSIHVGDSAATAAHHRLTDVEAVHAWLRATFLTRH